MATKTPDPVGSKYAGVVSRESVRIAFTYAALNELDVCMADIRNAYLQSPTSQKHYIICGPEFGMENVGKVAIMHRAVYGGKTSRRDFRNHLRSCMHFINFTSYPADPSLLRRQSQQGPTGKWCKCMSIQFIPICSNSSQECGGRSDVRRQEVLEDVK